MTMDVVKEQGLSACLASAVNTANQAEAGYGLSIDIDAIDPSQAPFVATPVENGIDATKLAQALADLPRKDRLLGMEVTEFTPRDGRGGEPNDADVAANLITSLVTAVTGVVV